MAFSYHNTNNLRGSDLKSADKRAMKQEKWVSEFFRKNRGTPMTPDTVKYKYDRDNNTESLNNGSGVLLTSIRRAMSNLTKGEGAQLVKMDLTTTSPRGGRESYWVMPAPEVLELDLVMPVKQRMGDN